MTNSNTNSQSFTRTNAKYLASKIAANLMRMQRLYSEPSNKKIAEYELEAIELLTAGYAEKVMYGFKRGGNWIPPTLIYTISDIENIYESDDDPGEIERNLDVSNASFHSFLTYSDSWQNLTKEQQQKFKDAISINRYPGYESPLSGYLVNDHTYSSGGEAINRTSLKKY